ncbi:hypothetical protein NE237_015410 [Protea cynaroides]|uniref:Uncharacterized protein n=1 Tax=Protea cynaroides TaxID=273540 RepID=A0A9Q0KE56_9MAGN|nr:hypothetical protein NE237_015410 [Protea cynaroides]
MVALSSLQSLHSLIRMNSYSSSSSSSHKSFLMRRKSIFFASSILASFLHFYPVSTPSFQKGTKKDFSAAILERKKAANPETMEKLQLFRGDTILIKVTLAFVLLA